ncbi:hypothetical protein M3Y94_00582100 [Aphelenchoides besseyi]|nr:hypothetical protein M3Y94_00582100 [Aphelenchoides besseyi]KAI6222039.1 INO80 complex subunit E [Aphelenchoides besseyi]
MASNNAARTGPNATTYTMQQRPGAVLAQRGVATSGTQHQLIIYTRNDQQAYSQGQAPGTYTIIQTQSPGEPPRTVYQPRSMVNSGRQEIQRQYVQTTANGPATSTSGSSTQQSGSTQPPVLHIQVLPHSGAPTSTQAQLVDKRINHVTSLPPSHAHSSTHQQIISGHLQGQASDQVVVADRRPGPSSSIAVHHQQPLPAQRPAPRSKAQRSIPTAPPPPQQIKQEELFDDLTMHPTHMPMPDSFNMILDQLHSSGESPKAFYRKLKKQFKYLVYENECYQEELRNSQRHLLKLSRDKNFLLDRLAVYEVVEDQSEDDDSDADSDATVEEKPKPKKKKVQQSRKRTAAGTVVKKNAKEAVKMEEDNNSQASMDGQTPQPQPASQPVDQTSQSNAVEPMVPSTSVESSQT